MRWFRVLGALCLLACSRASAAGAPLEFHRVADGIYTLTSVAHGNKIVIGEYRRFLVIIEFPQSDTLVNAILEEASARFPGKPVRYVLHTHHHAHSVSGFDPFLRRTGACLVTSRFNYGEIAALTRDTLALRQRVVLTDSVFTVKGRGNRLVLYTIPQSKYAVPTPEYNVVYFPEQEVLVSGCLFNKPLAYYEVVTPRKPALRKFIADRGLVVRTLVPTNTSRASGYEDVCTLAMLDSALVRGLRPDVLADALQARSLDYLESHADSLIGEFRRIPRSYDYLVCANALRNTRKDYDRAILVYRCLTRIYPEEPDSYYFIGECYETKGYRLEALAYFERCRELTKDPADLADVGRRIEKLKQP